MPSFELSPEADADLDDIFDYTARLWGADQAYKYLLDLDVCAEAMVAGERSFKSLDSFRRGMRMCRCQHHYIICVMRDDEPALVVAMLHERMDLMSRIVEQLK